MTSRPSTSDTLQIRTGRGFFWHSLRTRLIIAFVVQIVAVVLAVGWLTFSDSEDSVRDVAAQLRAELSERVRQKVKAYVDVPVALNSLNADGFITGELSFEDHRKTARHFWKQMGTFPTVAYISVGTREGKFFGIKRMNDGRLQLRERTEKSGGALQSWELDDHGKPYKLVGSKPNYDPRKRSWYTQGSTAEGTVWAGIESYYSSPNELATGPVTAVMRGGEVLGVLSTDLQLSQLGQFMKQMKIGKTGVAVIVDSDGVLVGSSTHDPITTDVTGEARPIPATQSPNDRVRSATRFLRNHFGRFNLIQTVNHLSYEKNGERFFITVLPFKTHRNLDWLIIISVPANDFLERITEGRQLTLLFCFIAVIVAILFAVGISRGITDPLLKLTRLARRIQSGDLNLTLEARSKDEIGTLAVTMNEMVQGLRDRDFIRDAFGRYLSPELAERFMQDRDSLRLGGHMEQVTILMSDLRGFTALSERLGPEQMVQLLNRYLGCMTDVILKYRGTIIEFIGDAILVLFGAPIRDEDDAERAVRCAIDMQRAMVFFNKHGAEEDIPALEMGIAVNTGQVVAGNIGSESHVKYGVVGEPVNLTARIESLNVGGQVLISEATYSLVSSTIDVDGPKVVRLKGVSGPLKVFELLGMKNELDARVPDSGDGEMMEVNLNAEVFVIRGYEVDEVPQPAKIVRLGARRVDIVTDPPLAPMSKVKVRLELPGGNWTSDTYANVSDEEVLPATTMPTRTPIRLGFTSVMNTDRLALDDVFAAVAERMSDEQNRDPSDEG
jgi:adenylate cyclase